MRKKLEQLLIEKAREDKGIYLLVNDLGSFDNFRKEFPDRFVNCGIGEPNMVSVAAGLSLEGNTPIIYSVAGFCIHRGFEQLKFDMCYRGKKLVIVNAAAGLCYNKVGAGHYLVDDFALMGSLPEVDILAPIDIPEFTKMFNDAVSVGKISYIRTGLDGCPDTPTYRGYIKKGNYDVTLVSTGVFSAVASKICVEFPINIFHLGKLQKTVIPGKVILLEDHIAFGGLSSYVEGEVIDHIHLPERVSEMAETREELLKKYGLDNESIKTRISSHI